MKFKKRIVIPTAIAVGYWIFLNITSSVTFVREDVEVLNRTYALSDSQLQDACDKMSSWSYVSGLTDGAIGVPLPHGRTYYYKSRCYMELATRTQKSEWCAKVTKRISLFFDGSSVSKESCLNEVSESLKRQSGQLEQATKNETIFVSAMKITEVQARPASPDKWNLKIKVSGSHQGQYKLEIINGAASIQDANRIILSEHLTIPKDPTEIERTIELSQLTKCNGCEIRPKRIYPIAVGLTLIKTQEPSATSAKLPTSLVNTTISIETPPKQSP